MEFLLVPLLAIIVVTFGIYKLTAMIFHIRLSGALLALLVVFAWLVSLVLPGLFFQKAGFLGSVGISLASALGFAWLATTFDAKRQSPQVSAVATGGETRIHSTEQTVAWTPPAEATAPLLPKEEWREVVVEATHSLSTEEPRNVQEPALEPADAAAEESANQTAVAVAAGPEQPVAATVSIQDVAAISEAYLLDEDYLEPDSDEVPEVAATADLVEPEVEAAQEPEEPEVWAEPEASAEPAGQAVQNVLPVESDAQPASDSLEDLLEFAFAQRSQGNATGALTTFRLIRGLYADSLALPMVVAEIVSTLQSQGHYQAAIDELSEIADMPMIRLDSRLAGTFVQKLDFLQLLRQRLIERGFPDLPFDQVPMEWQAEIEQELLTGNRVQS